jgi:hypothetical protein
MASDLERALDEILTGVNALMQQAPKSAAPFTAAPPLSKDVPLVGGSVTALAADQVASMLAVLAILESEPSNDAAGLAGRLTHQLLMARCVRTASLSDEFDHVTVSPLIYPVFQGLHEIGARWIESSADSLLWQMAGVDIARAQEILGKFSSVVCPEQNEDGLCWRLPRIPERSPLNWITAGDVSAPRQLISAEQVAVIDLDKSGKKPSTIIWSSRHHFVPDWWCGSAFYQGKWRPVVHWAAAEFPNS